jgi:hypothetical protein
MLWSMLFPTKAAVTMRFRRIALLSLPLVLLLLGAAAVMPADASLLAKLNGNLVPPRGVLFGIYAKKRDGRTHNQQIRHVERQVRHRFAIDHFYFRFDQSLADPQVKLTIRQGRIPLINWSPESHGIITWGAIASGRVDGLINQQARALRRLRKPVMLAFHHEPENDVGRYGTAAEYRAAFRHIVRRFRAEHARNVRFVCILEGYTYEGGNGGVRQWYPGRRFVDWAAADAYNWAPGRAGYSWRSFKSAFKGFYNWGKLRHKPLMAAEFGTQEKPGDPTAKAAWITNARRTLRRWPRMKAVVYFNSNSQWPWWINTSRSSLRAYRGLVHDRRLQP